MSIFVNVGCVIKCFCAVCAGLRALECAGRCCQVPFAPHVVKGEVVYLSPALCLCVFVTLHKLNLLLPSNNADDGVIACGRVGSVCEVHDFCTL